MTPYDAKPFAVLTNQIKKGSKYELSKGQSISDNILISKALTLLANTLTNIYINDNE